MDKMECIATAKTFLWKCFWIGLIFNIAFGFIYISNKEMLAEFANKMVGISPEAYFTLVIDFLTNAKLIIFHFFLIPAIALSCMCVCVKCKEGKS